MKRYQISLGICLVILIVVSIWWLTRSQRATGEPRSALEQPTGTTNIVMPQKQQPSLEARQQVVSAIESALNAPITFYGKVVDQNGEPVPFARAAYGLLDKFNESGTNGHVDADANGFFTIQGVRGAAIGVNVSKSGYYQIHKVSDQYFGYGGSGDSMSKPAPLPEKPAVFVLQKMGRAEALVHLTTRTFKVARNGTPIEVNLATGMVVPNGDLKIEAWTNDPSKNTPKRYDWNVRVSVPGGGLLKRENVFDFEAPVDGYKNAEEISMSATSERWRPEGEGDYFLKLADGRHARVMFKMIAQGDHFFRIESLLNPTPGSRNLEFDPAKVIKPTKQ